MRESRDRPDYKEATCLEDLQSPTEDEAFGLGFLPDVNRHHAGQDADGESTENGDGAKTNGDSAPDTLQQPENMQREQVKRRSKTPQVVMDSGSEKGANDPVLPVRKVSLDSIVAPAGYVQFHHSNIF